jgi:hypothetical protein
VHGVPNALPPNFEDLVGKSIAPQILSKPEESPLNSKSIYSLAPETEAQINIAKRNDKNFITSPPRIKSG